MKKKVVFYLSSLLPAGFIFFVRLIALAKTYSFAIFGVALAGANCKCVWLLA
jgi:hypothetical protein